MHLLARILLWAAKFIPWIVTGITWFNKLFSVLWAKLLVAYFGSRIAITITLLAFGVTLVYMFAEIGGVFGQLVAGFVVGRLESFDNELVKFCFNYCPIMQVFEGLFFFISSWSAYLGCCKSLWIFQKSLQLLRVAQGSIK